MGTNITELLHLNFLHSLISSSRIELTLFLGRNGPRTRQGQEIGSDELNQSFLISEGLDHLLFLLSLTLGPTNKPSQVIPGHQGSIASHGFPPLWLPSYDVKN
ncbi:cytochrome b subunit of formate dehydrogenase [Striga asiatica]|uniref:Cytochrome b subunit of formate dehydrogenase n=1 Tax=Striga asiatica TaxID=4170 RepID=A0A5A7Q6H0_STRAF|nr:cytochrome b subunit of formate dehydrogenase [Striga asiatica]